VAHPTPYFRNTDLERPRVWSRYCIALLLFGAFLLLFLLLLLLLLVILVVEGGEKSAEE